MKYNKIIILLMIISMSVFAQTEVDALRYSQDFNGGTARFVSMGGAFGALGGDLSTTSYNPAGIGVFRKSSFTFTPNLVFNSTQSDYLGNRSNDFRTNFNVNNIGMVSSSVYDRSSGLVAINWAFVYNRNNNYHFNSLAYGNNTQSSITDFFANNSNGYSYEDLDPFRERLAWETYNIDNVDSVNYIYSSALPERGEYQERRYRNEGYKGSGDFSIGLNFANRLYWGGTVGIVWTRFTSTMEHIESDQTGDIDNFNSLYYKEYLHTSGTGVNFKTGFIYKITPAIRISGAIHSPTYFSLHDYYYTFMEGNYDDVGVNHSLSPDLFLDYEFQTPGKLLAGMAFVIEKQAIISFDYEYLDYSWAKFENSYYFYAGDVNRRIDDLYTSAHNFKLGGEYRYSYYSFRAGVGYYGSPFNSGSINHNSYTMLYSTGVGVNFGPLFLDLAYLYQQNKSYFYLYDSTPNHISEPVKYTKYSSKIMMTMGIRF